ncbi:MAG: YceI family protein [Deltaproteobacteria bacterium]|nr:YceI family protein [Deltaproteobacteria bacterium]
MKRLLLTLALVIGLPGIAAAAETYQLDVQQSQIEWVGKKVTGQHNGLVTLKGGQVTLDGQKLTGGDFKIDMKSIKVLDLTDPAANQKLTNHLNSDDFFSTASHPESVFKITSVKDLGSGKAEITGDLTIKGITKPVTFPAELSFQGDKIKATGTLKLDRTLWNIRYGSGKFFQGLGDKLIYDEFELKLNLYAKK